MEDKKYWHLDGSPSPRFNKTSLGKFVYTVLAEGADIVSIWPFNRSYKHSSVFFVIKATEEQKNCIESLTKYKLRKPPRVDLT